MRYVKQHAIFFFCFTLSWVPIQPIHAQVNQERWAYEYSSGIGAVQSPFFGTNIDLPISSSWNEPRTNETHKGIDQAARGGTSVGPMYETARVLVNETISGGGNTQTIRYYNVSTGKTYYSTYMHLSAFVKSNNTVVYPSDVTAKTGNSGLNCVNGCYHLHFELLDSIAVTEYKSYPYFAVDYNSRVSVNPIPHLTPSSSGISDNTWNDLSVFKQGTVSRRRLQIQGINTSSDGLNQLSQVKLYFKTSASPYYSVADMMKSGTAYWYYDFPSHVSYADYFVIGRRSSSERWVSFPAKRLNLGTDATGLKPSPNQCGCTYDTIRIQF